MQHKFTGILHSKILSATLSLNVVNIVKAFVKALAVKSSLWWCQSQMRYDKCSTSNTPFSSVKGLFLPLNPSNSWWLPCYLSNLTLVGIKSACMMQELCGLNLKPSPFQSFAPWRNVTERWSDSCGALNYHIAGQCMPAYCVASDSTYSTAGKTKLLCTKRSTNLSMYSSLWKHSHRLRKTERALKCCWKGKLYICSLP